MRDRDTLSQSAADNDEHLGIQYTVEISNHSQKVKFFYLLCPYFSDQILDQSSSTGDKRK